jgi:uncharacterized alpha-E superfamily protein
MLSRVADSLYWMSRYIERAENTARFIDVNLSLMLDQPGDEQWEPLVTTTGDRELFRSRYDRADRESVVRFLAFDRDYHSSILSSVRAARENARAVRSAISSDMWLQLNKFYLLVQEAAARGHAAGYEFFAEVKNASYLFAGITDATMTRDEAWHFVRLGRLLERADKTSRIVDVKYYLLLPSLSDVGKPIDELQWAALLRSASGLRMYRHRHHQVTPDRAVAFLILDRDFPRAVRYCLEKALRSLKAIDAESAGHFEATAKERLDAVHSELAQLKVEAILNTGLHEFVDDLQARLNGVDGALHEALFPDQVQEQTARSAHRSDA